MTQTVPVRAAATIMLLRETPSLEVLMVRRNYQIDFFSGAMVFPGGKVAEDDFSEEEQWLGFPIGTGTGWYSLLNICTFRLELAGSEF